MSIVSCTVMAHTNSKHSVSSMTTGASQDTDVWRMQLDGSSLALTSLNAVNGSSVTGGCVHTTILNRQPTGVYEHPLKHLSL